MTTQPRNICSNKTPFLETLILFTSPDTASATHEHKEVQKKTKTIQDFCLLLPRAKLKSREPQGPTLWVVVHHKYRQHVIGRELDVAREAHGPVLRRSIFSSPPHGQLSLTHSVDGERKRVIVIRADEACRRGDGKSKTRGEHPRSGSQVLESSWTGHSEV